MEVKKGSDLYSSHYDSVELGIRQRYEKMRREKEKKEKQVQAAINKLAVGSTGRKR